MNASSAKTTPDTLGNFPISERHTILGIDLTVGRTAEGEKFNQINFDFHRDTLPTKAELAETIVRLLPENIESLRQVSGVIGYV